MCCNKKNRRSEDMEHLEIQLALARIEDKLDELEEKLEDIHDDIEDHDGYDEDDDHDSCECE